MAPGVSSPVSELWKQGRDVFAIPGNILDGHSDGCHLHLIQEGAKLISSGQDVLAEFEFLRRNLFQINFSSYIGLGLDKAIENGLHL